MARGISWCVGALSVWLTFASAADAQARRVEMHFTPTARAQLALWVESQDGSRFETVRLTQAVSYRGIGNRPGALQMNSGFLWPFGRREGVLPVWAHRRVAAGQSAFRRVVFNGRASEGNASSAGSSGEPRNTRDDYFCLSFNQELSGRDYLDAVSCASVFNSNKGRYLDDEDVASGYAEPYVDDDGATMRPLSFDSLYPPRRDVIGCPGGTCGDHETVATFALDARDAMPEIDVVTMATPEGERAQTIVFDVPEDWPNGAYYAYLEINVEGDYNDTYNATTYPTPEGPAGGWDYWAVRYGYPYRGQPALVYRVPFEIRPVGGSFSTADPAGFSALHGEDGEIYGMNSTVTDDPIESPGSGADRLRTTDGVRFEVVVPPWDICNQEMPPPECGEECSPEEITSCGDGLLCGPDATCVGVCDVPMRPGSISGVEMDVHPNDKDSHHFAVLRFSVPESPRRITRYEVRFSNGAIVDVESFQRARPAVLASIEPTELTVPVEGEPGHVIEVEIGGLTPETTYDVAIRAADECNALGPITTAQITTTPINFTTVSPCFVATAAYGSPLASHVSALRRFRDRHLRSNAIGRALVDAYYEIGPHLADAIRGSEDRRAAARGLLTPLVWLVEQLP